MNNKVYNKWITESPKVILQDVLVTLENSVELTYVDYKIDKSDNYKMVHGCPAKNILAYMNIATMDIDRTGWHGDYTDEEEPKKDGRYIVCLEIKQYGRTRYKLSTKHWRKNKFYGCKYDGEEIIGWRKFPKPFKEKVNSSK